jgi:hypothetical protein
MTERKIIKHGLLLILALVLGVGAAYVLGAVAGDAGTSAGALISVLLGYGWMLYVQTDK